VNQLRIQEVNKLGQDLW